MTNQEVATLSLTCAVAFSFLVLAISSWQAARKLEPLKDLRESDTTALTGGGDIVFSSEKADQVLIKLPGIVYGLVKASAIGFACSLIPLFIQIYYLIEE
jgi:hypothetical protein